MAQMEEIGGDMTVDLNILQSFCDESRSLTATPFSIGRYTVATDGHIMVRVPRMAEVPERKNAPAIDFSEPHGDFGKFFCADPAQWVAAPQVEIQRGPCPICNGTTKLFVCPECSGDGTVTSESEFHSYENDCSMCDGAGSVSAATLEEHRVNPAREKQSEKTCDNCKDGTVVTAGQGVSIGAAQFAPVQLQRLSVLPEVEIGVVSPLAPARFRFKGGDGLLMPLRPKG